MYLEPRVLKRFGGGGSGSRVDVQAPLEQLEHGVVVPQMRVRARNPLGILLASASHVLPRVAIANLPHCQVVAPRHRKELFGFRWKLC